MRQAPSLGVQRPAYFGAESAGSLVLLPPGQDSAATVGRRPLTDQDLSARIRNLPRVPLMHDAPKRMAVAGAQHKLLVVLEGDNCNEPLPGDASTHILKPNQAQPLTPADIDLISEYLASLQ